MASVPLYVVLMITMVVSLASHLINYALPSKIIIHIKATKSIMGGETLISSSVSITATTEYNVVIGYTNLSVVGCIWKVIQEYNPSWIVKLFKLK